MVFYYMSEGQKLLSLDEPQDGCWVSMIKPNDEEIQSVSSRFSVDADDLRSALDTDERSRIAVEDNYVMILVNIPTVEDDTERELYDTIPLSIFVAGKSVITVCSEETPVLQPFSLGRIKDFNTTMRSRFVMQILYRNASLYLQYLRNIERQSDMVENKMYKSTQNSELFELLKLEKSLVYFTTALRSNEVVMEKLFKSDRFKKYPEDAELLEDVIIENKQAIEMTQVYREIINGTRELLSTVINNRLNNVMKVLTSVTIVMAIPTVISGLYGMNVNSDGMPLANLVGGFGMICLLITVICLIAAIILRKRNML